MLPFLRVETSGERSIGEPEKGHPPRLSLHLTFRSTSGPCRLRDGSPMQKVSVYCAALPEESRGGSQVICRSISRRNLIMSSMNK